MEISLFSVTKPLGLLVLHVVLSHLLALLRCCRAVSFSDNVSDSELAKNCKSATVDGEVLEPRCPTISEMSEGIAKERKNTYCC